MRGCFTLSKNNVTGIREIEIGKVCELSELNWCPPFAFEGVLCSKNLERFAANKEVTCTQDIHVLVPK